MKARPVFLAALAVTLAGAGWWWWWMRHAGDDREQRLLGTLDPAHRARFDGLLRALRRAGLRVVLSYARRTREEQAALHAANPGGAAPPGSSKHERGHAVDVLLTDAAGKLLPDDHEAWRDAGRVGKELGFVWGGDFRRVYDAGHFEVA